ncbi:MAG: amylo-alpha-1,6-glucosidase [Thermoanaerobaculia bacterium]
MVVATMAKKEKDPKPVGEASGGVTIEPVVPTRFVAADALRDFERAAELEWLETNGLGGWASSTVGGAHTRRYHGLLVAATRPPAGRRVLLSKLEETVVLASGSGERIELGTNRFPGAIHPRGFDRLVSFARDPFPVCEYEDKGFRLRKRICAIHGENTVVVVYELLEGGEGVVLELRPLLAGRDIHSLGRAEASRVWTGREVQPGPCVRFSVAAIAAVAARAARETDLFIGIRGATFRPEGTWYFDFEYSEEKARGFDYREDLYMPGVFSLTLEVGRPVAVFVSTAEPAGRDPLQLVAAEKMRRACLLDRAELPVNAGPGRDLERQLVVAADQFIVARDLEIGGGSTIIAGYPWFADWGRDAMIALPGLCLETGRVAEAREILRGFADAASQGMLPNRFPEAGEAPEYNTVDAALWLFVTAQRYLDATGDDDFVCDALLPVMDDILAWYGRGTRYGIQVDGDGLLRAGEPGVQLTWMDARVGERVITPRTGRPVEIEALWYNALRIASTLHRRYGNARRAAMVGSLAKVVRARFEDQFWNAEKGELFDVLNGTERDPASRPNQLYALALPHPLLSREHASTVLDNVERKLVTPRGLRSLAADEPGYVPRYLGGPEERDAAYHQGTVWAFLAGIYVDALLRYRGAGGRRQARGYLQGFAVHLDEAGLGSVSEIFDAEAPHLPRGAIAQAWSVAELLRALRRVSP